MSKGAIYVENSQNEKITGLGKCDATYASIRNTCSSTCPLQKNNLCYAEQSFTGMTVKRLDRLARQHSPLVIAREEAKCIDNAYGGRKIPNGRDMRVHVSGDCKVRSGVKLINAAVGRWKKRGGRDCWSYTHSHANIPRSLWSNVSILASIEDVCQIGGVRKMGYAPALVISEFANDKAFTVPECETRFIPCPAQTKDNVSCVSCRLCMKADWLYETNRGIAFAAHGIKKNDLKRRLTVLQWKPRSPNP
jgi:hypothetical protein